jgi:flagellar biosynthesis/type III secretory pathway M-ring protein FliF/YscJ
MCDSEDCCCGAGSGAGWTIAFLIVVILLLLAWINKDKFHMLRQTVSTSQNDAIKNVKAQMLKMLT